MEITLVMGVDGNIVKWVLKLKIFFTGSINQSQIGLNF